MSAVQTCHRLLPDTDCNVNSNDRCGSLALPEFARRYPRILVPHGPHLILLYEEVIEQFLIFMPLCKAVFPTGSGIMGCREDVPSAPGRIGCGAGITLHSDEKLMIGTRLTGCQIELCTKPTAPASRQKGKRSGCKPPSPTTITSRGGLEIGWRAKRAIFDLDAIPVNRDGPDETSPRLTVAVGGPSAYCEVHPVQSMVPGRQP